MGFASEGAAVSICARSEGALRETEADLKTFGGKVHAAPCDLGDGPAVRGYVEDAAKAPGAIDILITNASGSGRTDYEEGWPDRNSVVGGRRWSLRVEPGGRGIIKNKKTQK